MECEYLLSIKHLFYTISPVYITPTRIRRKKFTYWNMSVLRRFTPIMIVTGIVNMAYPPSNENTDSSEPASFQNTYPPDRNTIEDMIVSIMWASLDTSYSSIQYTLSTSILHSLNIPPITATNEENMYRNITGPSNDVFLLFSRMVMIIGIMNNDILSKLV